VAKLTGLLKEIVNIKEQISERKLLLNFSALSSVQFVNGVIPLVVLPYLYRVLGVEKLGYVFLAQAVAGFFIQFVDFAFSNTAVRAISQNRASSLLPFLTGRLFTLRICLLLIGFPLYSALGIAIPDVRTSIQSYLISYMLVAAQAVNPYWFLQGIDKTKYYALINLVGKVLFVISIFVLIRSESDYYLVNGIQGVTVFFTGLTGWYFIQQKKFIRFTSVSVKTVITEFNAGLSNFLSGLIVFGNSGCYLLLTGYFAGATQAGYYGIAEKIFLLGRALPIMIHQAIYPHVCRIAENSFHEVRKFFKQFYLFLLPVFIPITGILFFFSSEIISLITGSLVYQAAKLVKIVSPIPFLAAVSIPLAQTLSAKHFNRSYLNASLIGSSISVLIAMVLISQFMATGAAVAALLGELIMIASMFFQIERNHRDYSLFTKPVIS